MKLYKAFLVLAILIIIALFFFPRVSAKADVEAKVTAPQPTVVLSNADQIRRFSAMYGIDSKLPLAIAQCESQMYARAKNPNSTASGLFQFIASSWAGYAKKHWGEVGDVFSAEDNADLGVWVIATYGTDDWLASSSCWKK